jgi:hypothetical protein
MARSEAVQRLCEVRTDTDESEDADGSASGSGSRLGPRAYRLALLDSALTLCPGGQRMEQHRVWEALESGSVPVISVEDGTLSLLGDHHPLPVLKRRDWGGRGLVASLEAWAEDAASLDRRQQEVMMWYKNFKARKRAEAAAAILGGEE